MARRRVASLVVGLGLLALFAGGAHAHGRSTSTSAWELEAASPAAARVLVRVPWRALQQVLPALGGVTQEMLAGRPGLAALVDGYLVARVALFAGGERCGLTGAVRPAPTPNATHASRAWRVLCREGGLPELRIDPFLEAAASHVHIARVRMPDGETVERVFVLGSTRLSLDVTRSEAASHGSGVMDYLSLGIEHIATGADHLVFLLALLLLGASLLEVATVVTGFTVAHSVTLALGALGVVEPLPSAIEALIGLSIIVVALENFAQTVGRATRRTMALSLAAILAVACLGALAGAVAIPVTALAGISLFSLSYLALLGHVERPARLRWCIAFFFGLIHGFGFAGLLTEIGLPADRLVPALLGFNLGVEVGQLAIVAGVWPVLHWLLRRDPGRRALLVQVGSTPLLVAGFYWFATRALG